MKANLMNNELDNFKVELNNEKNRLIIIAKGFIDEKGVEIIPKMVMDKAKSLKDNAGVLLDLRDFSLAKKSDDLKSGLLKVLPQAKYFANVSGTSPVGSMQVRRLSSENTTGIEIETFEKINDAVKWLDSKQG